MMDKAAVEQLSSLIETMGGVLMVAQDIGVNPAQIRSSGSVLVAWSDLLRVSLQSDKLHQLCDSVAKEYPSRSGDIKRELATYKSNLVEEIRARSDATLRQHARIDRYQTRTLEASVRRFLLSDGRACMVIVGGSGVGKTTMMKTLLHQLRCEGHLTFFLPSQHFRVDLDKTKRFLLERIIPSSLCETICSLGDNDEWRLPDALARQLGCRLLIGIDAVNEYSRSGQAPLATPVEFFGQLDRLIADVHERYPSIRFLVTCRPETWRKCDERKHQWLSERAYFPDGDRGVAHYLREYDDEEARSAFELYRASFDIGTPYDGLSETARRLLKDPLLMALGCEAYKGRAIPPDLETPSIFERYEKRLQSDAAQYGIDYASLINRVVRHLFLPTVATEGASAVTVYREFIDTDLLSRTDADLYSKLTCDLPTNEFNFLRDQKILRPPELLSRLQTGLASGHEGPPPLIHFNYDRFLEYKISQYILARIAPEPSGLSSGDTLFHCLQVNLDAARRYNVVLGALTRVVRKCRCAPKALQDVLRRLTREGENGLSLVLGVLTAFAQRGGAGDEQGVVATAALFHAFRKQIDQQNGLPRRALAYLTQRFLRGKSARAEPLSFPVVYAAYRLCIDDDHHAWLRVQPGVVTIAHRDFVVDVFAWSLRSYTADVRQGAVHYLYFLWSNDRTSDLAREVLEQLIRRCPVPKTNRPIEWYRFWRDRHLFMGLVGFFVLAIATARTTAQSARVMPLARQMVEAFNPLFPALARKVEDHYGSIELASRLIAVGMLHKERAGAELLGGTTWTQRMRGRLLSLARSVGRSIDELRTKVLMLRDAGAQDGGVISALVIFLLTEVLDNMPNPVSGKAMVRLYYSRHDLDTMRILLRLIRGLDPWDGDVVLSVLVGLSKESNALIPQHVAYAISVRHYGSNDVERRDLRAFLLDIFDRSDNPVVHYTVVLAMYHICYFGDHATQADLDAMVQMSTFVLSKHGGHFWLDDREYNFHVIGMCGRCVYRLAERDMPDGVLPKAALQFLVDALHDAKSASNALQYRYICKDVGLLGILVEPTQVFDVITEIMRDLGDIACSPSEVRAPFGIREEDKGEIRISIIKSLANIRAIFRAEVDRYLADDLDPVRLGASDSFAHRVSTTKPDFNIKELYSWTGDELFYRAYTRYREQVGNDMLDSLLDRSEIGGMVAAMRGLLQRVVARFVELVTS